ncbi:metalloprotease PmbA [Methylomarinum sp. Ch1-1]|uniref:Metalloprotease PmbA n=1 Tax=Methylomarinum roseum TaxID=3067653 RepID=A0AAU7NXZ6_9GAMM|nr:metalloprotease PmbA [Methylomarinum sp. Ch1-1]MDP4522063.1 metalloprotease PmbA [Methylomarinum sp. Ch1-1]
MQNQEQINQLKNIVQDLLNEAERQGASAAEAGLSVDNGLSVTARMGDVETIEYHCDQGLAIAVYFDQRKGSASSNDLSPEALKETVKAACSIARYASEDPYAGLPEKRLLATEFRDLDLNHPWSLDAEQAIALAVQCENAARAYHADISNSEGASVNSHQGVRVLGNSLGFLHGYRSSRHSVSCSVLAGRDERMQRDYWYTVSRDPGQLESVVAVGEKAAQRALRRQGARSLSTRQCPVLYAPEMATGLIGSLAGAISGGNLYRKSSFLLDALDTPIMPEFVRIHEQPFLQGALGSANYDAEGVATSARDIVTDGILQSYLLSSYSARKLGMQSTGNAGGVHNLTVDAGDNDFAAMLKQMGDGLLVTELMGQGVNMVTGDYSRGASGFWVENGEISYPVQEITIAGNLKDMFKHIVAIGNDVDYRGNIRTGSILVEQMSVAGE